MLSREENELLCGVGPGTPMGQMLRRYWLPACLSEELEPEGAPVRIRLLGEDLVAFRDAAGTVSILDEHCPHRGASLALARSEDCALTCIYHGWKIAGNGEILDTPAEPEESDFRSRVRHVAYAAREAGDVIWAYMGPPGLEPTFPAFEWTLRPAHQRRVIKMREECNWVQSLEGVIDSAHSNFLHSMEIRPSAEAAVPNGATKYVGEVGQTTAMLRPSNDTRPRLEVQNTDYGFRYAAIRKPLVEPDKYKYIRTTAFVAPCHGFFSPPEGWIFVQIFVPMDETHTMTYYVQCHREQTVDPEKLPAYAGGRPGIDIDADARKIRTPENNFLQDRVAMKAKQSFSGIYGVVTQDMAVQESMGPIYDRTREHLGTSDVAIIRFRNVMLNSVRSFQKGGIPLGLERPFPYERVRAEEKIVPLDVPWQTIGAYAGEPTAEGVKS